MADFKDTQEVKKMKVQNSLTGIENLMEFLEETADEWKLEVKQKLEVNLIVEELCTNCIKYSGEDPESAIEVKLCFEEAQMTIEIIDNGAPFDPLEFPPPDIHLSLADRKDGGLGIHLVRKFSEKIRYQRKDGKNIVTIVKNIQ